MLKNPQQIVQLALAVSTFALVLSVWIGLVLLWSAKRSQKAGRVHRRLGIEKSRAEDQRVLHLWHEGSEVTTMVPGVRHSSVLRRIEEQFRRAGMTLTGAQIVV